MTAVVVDRRDIDAVLGEAFEPLLEAARSGAGWARARLYEALAGPVTGYLRAQGVADPEDGTSEVFLAVFTRLPAFRGTGTQFRSWVFTIAHHKVVDERRRRARRPDPGPLGDGEDAALGHHLPAEEEALARIDATRLTGLLDRLTPDQRDVISLRILADLSVEQVAAALGKAEGAVKALQRRGLEALRKHFVHEGVSR